jgi:hypothetical protein
MGKTTKLSEHFSHFDQNQDIADAEIKKCRLDDEYREA